MADNQDAVEQRVRHRDRTLALILFGGVLVAGVIVTAGVVLFSHRSTPAVKPVVPVAPVQPISQVPTSVRPTTGRPPIPDQSTSKPGPREDVCNTLSCVATSDVLHEHLDPLVKPCDDFEKHVCGRYSGSESNLLRAERDRLLDKIAEEIRNPTDALQETGNKAAAMFKSCENSLVRSSEDFDVLREFMSQLGLTVGWEIPLERLSARSLLELHVKLAFAFELSGLFLLRPATRRSLHLSPDLSFMSRLEAYPSPKEFFKAVAQIYNGSGSGEGGLGAELHRDAQAMVRSLTGPYHKYPFTTAASRFGDIRYIKMGGVPPGTFAKAVAEKTPYKNDTEVELEPVVLDLISAFWRQWNVVRLYQWTSWNVLAECAVYVSPALWRVVDKTRFARGCLRRVLPVLGSKLLLPTLLQGITDQVRKHISKLIKNVAKWLSQNASRWLQLFDIKPVFVGFSNTVERDPDARYAAIPMGHGHSFLRDWIEAARVRDRLIFPDDTHVDPFREDVAISERGDVFVPAVFLVSRLFTADGPLAVDYGGLGHMVARSIVARFLRTDAPSVLPCAVNSSSNWIDLTENLLAYLCVQSLFRAETGPRASLRLPTPPGPSTPMQLLLTMGCLKDCSLHRYAMPSSCRVSQQYLKVFDEAFQCSTVQSQCKLR